MPIRGGFSTRCASAASSVTRTESASVAGVRLSASIQRLIKFGYLICDARDETLSADIQNRSPRPTTASDLSNAALSGRREQARAPGRCSGKLWASSLRLQARPQKHRRGRRELLEAPAGFPTKHPPSLPL